MIVKLSNQDYVKMTQWTIALIQKHPAALAQHPKPLRFAKSMGHGSMATQRNDTAKSGKGAFGCPFYLPCDTTLSSAATPAQPVVAEVSPSCIGLAEKFWHSSTKLKTTLERENVKTCTSIE